jgi:hypothetical protein
MDKALDIFKYVKKHEDDYLDFAEYYPPIKSFFGEKQQKKGEQQKIWDKSKSYSEVFEESRSYVLNNEIESIIDKMEDILKMPYPYNKIKDLPELNDRFLDIYNKILDKELKPVKLEINEAEKRVTEVLKQSGLEKIFHNKFSSAFSNLIKKAESCNNVAKVNGFRIEADKLKMRFLDEIAKEQEHIAEKERAKKAMDQNEANKVVKPIKKQFNISIKDINPSNSWQIENKDDLEKYLQVLKIRLEKEIREDTILNVEF